MIADAPATLVWLSSRPPAAAETQSLSSWARAHRIALTPPGDEPPATIAVDLALVGPIEDLLGRARDAIAARDAEGVDHATEAAESQLEGHPELPQAAWLMAEVERARSTRWRRLAPQVSVAAERAWLLAEALDGGRVAGIGEVAATSHAVSASITVAIPGDDGAWLDGRELPSPPAGTPPSRSTSTWAGRHALVVTRRGTPIWARWLEIVPGESTLDVDVPGPIPCSVADVSRARETTEGVHAEGVRCAAWVAVVPGGHADPTRLRIAQCEADRCGPLLEWREAAAWVRAAPASLPGQPREAHGGGRGHAWPAWATWLLVGAGVALAGSVAVVASGALEPAPTTTRFVTGGLKSQ